MNGTVLLLVTWFFAGQQPSSYQTAFSNMAACNQAKAAVEAQQQKLTNDEANYVADIKSKGVIQMPRSIYVSAVCTAQ
ncbi:MAG TPA: hypothetical protein VFR09_00865 [Alphaproteobacteria bacterium]|nr:hypothetical protein [Alphaproteobacteria bacterium]